MIGSLVEHWKYTWADVWIVLERSRRAPPDLFVDLYRTAIEPPQDEIAKKRFDLVVNDPAQARNAFEQIRSSDFGDDRAIVEFLESAFTTIREFGVPRFENLYRYLVREFTAKYNLTYRIDDPFRVRLVLPGVFASFYDDLVRANRTDPHLRTLMNNFERAFGSYAKSKESHELNSCIHNAFIYAEGLAGKNTGKGGTLGKLCDSLKCWPHNTVRDSLKTLYGFRNDYPGLGHGANQKGKLRDLEPRDAIVVCLLLLSFSGYLSGDVSIGNTLTW